MSICTDYSGVILNQNEFTGSLNPDGKQLYQTFRLPREYQRGATAHETRFPSLSGFQVLVSVPTGGAADVVVEYTVDQYFFGEGWGNLAKGTTKECHADGKVWIDVFLEKEIPVDASMTTDVSLLRIGIKTTGVEKIWYSSPNPLLGEEAYEDTTELGSSLAFRILALSADEGTDFLGNPYRSVVVRASAHNTNTEGNSNSGYWLSSPQPSRFAVVSHYSDLRPFPEKPRFGVANEVPNPSFEYDVPGRIPALWDSSSSYWTKTGADLLVSNAEAPPHGKHYLAVATTGVRATEGVVLRNKIKVAVGVPKTFSVWVRILGAGGAMKIGLGDTVVGHEQTTFTATNTWTRVSVTLTPTASGTTQLAVCLVNEEARTFFIDGAMVNAGIEPANYVDGDQISARWDNQRGLSGSIELVDPAVKDDAIVIDSILMDPITSGVAFNVYYSNDLKGSEEGPPTDAQWAEKLWTHVSESYTTSQRKTYTLPHPIVAKFIKIEFSYLQAKSYNPGDFQMPIPYKKYPDWVANYFIASIKSPEFIAQNVGVTYDALEFAYNYFLGDLVQGPTLPQSPSESGPNIGQVDSHTLEQINLNLNRWTDPPAAQADPTTLLGRRAINEAFAQTDYPVEGIPDFLGPNNISVSSLNREPIILDQSMPIMYFYLTCRHFYKELRATFDHNRAYFAGVNELAYLRHTYTTSSDTELYIESGADDINTNRNDFVIEPGGDWFVY